MPNGSRSTSPRSLARRLFLSPLEDRTVPTALVGLTTTNQLVTFDSAAPGTITSTVAVSGLQPGETLVGIDFRPATALSGANAGQLFGLGSTSQLYQIDPAGGAATKVGGTFTPALTGNAFGFDFNPAVDKIRVVSNSSQSLRINSATGAATADTNLAYDAATYDAVVGGPPPAPQVVDAAYTQNPSATANGPATTTLYGLDAGTDLLVTIGGPDSDPNPNAGQLFAVGKVGFDVTPDSGFDIEPATDMAFATRTDGSNTVISSINLTTAQSAVLGTVPGVSLRGLAIAPAATGAGTIQLAANTFAFPANRGPVAVTVTRTGGTAGTETVNFATSDGTAGMGVDYLATNGTLTFAPGQTTQTIFLNVPGGNVAAAPAKTFNLTLSAPGGGAALGANTTAVVTIPATTGTPGATQSGRFFAASAGKGGGPVVNVYDAVSGNQVFTFTAFETTFTAGVTVATGDVNGDGVDDIVVGAGAGGGPRIAVFDGATQKSIADFFAYEDTFRGGVIVASGDVNGDGVADVVAGTGIGGGPRVRVIDGLGLAGNSPASLLDFFAFESSARGGVNVAVGEFNGDGFGDIIAGSGNGGGPRVSVFSGNPAGGNNPAVLANYFAYEDTFRGGVFVASGDVNGDGIRDVIAGTGPGGGPRVRAFSGTTNTGVPGADFFAYDANSRGGVRVATSDLNGDGIADIVTGAGPGGPSTVRIFSGAGTPLRDIDTFAGFTGGVFVG